MDLAAHKRRVEDADHADRGLADDAVAFVFVEAIHDAGLELMRDAGIQLLEYAFAFDDVIRFDMVFVVQRGGLAGLHPDVGKGKADIVLGEVDR